MLLPQCPHSMKLKEEAKVILKHLEKGSRATQSKDCKHLVKKGGGGVTNPGGVQGTFRCCTEQHGLVRNIGYRWTFGLDDLRGLF